MNYLKIRGNEIIKYPYTLTDLVAENPSMMFKPPYDFSVLYSETPEGKTGEYSVVQVQYSSESTYNVETQRLITSNNPPYLSNGQWTIDWEIRNLADDVHSNV
jgi:hypothetical protein